jgi:hypothetical protein
MPDPGEVVRREDERMSGRIAALVRIGIALASVAAVARPAAATAGAAEPYVSKEAPSDALLFGGRCTIVGRAKVSDDQYGIYAMCDDKRIFKTQLVHLTNDKWVLERSAENFSVIKTK